MFAWLSYKARLQNVRSELHELAESLSPSNRAELNLERVAAGVVAIARILVRVIDSLP